MHDEPDGAGTDGPEEPRRLLVRALNDRFKESGLSMERVAAKLKERLGPSGVEGLSKSSVSRYLHLDRTDLPDLSVLAELARIFGVDAEELERWQGWRRQAKLAAERALQHRRAARRVGAEPAEDGSGGDASAAEELVLSAPAGRAGAEAPPVAGAADGRRLHRWRYVAASMAVLAAVAVGAVWAGHRTPPASTGPDASSTLAPPPEGTTAPAAPSARRTGGSATGGSAAGVEVGALGEDSRCSAPKAGPSGVRLRACAVVEPHRVLFALKVDNPTDSSVDVTVKVSAFWTDAHHSCEPGPAVTHTVVVARTAFTTDPAHCVTARQDVPVAYQGEAFIAAGDGEEWAGHLYSPRANVYPGRETLWRCAGDVPC